MISLKNWIYSLFTKEEVNKIPEKIDAPQNLELNNKLEMPKALDAIEPLKKQKIDRNQHLAEDMARTEIISNLRAMGWIVSHGEQYTSMLPPVKKFGMSFRNNGVYLEKDGKEHLLDIFEIAEMSKDELVSYSENYK